MKKYKKIFINYIKEHINEFTFKVISDDYGTSYRFILPSPNKLFGIFPINFRFNIYTKPNCADNITVIDINTIFWKGIRLERESDPDIVKFLSEIFVNKCREYIHSQRQKKFYKLSDLTMKK